MAAKKKTAKKATKKVAKKAPAQPKAEKVKKVDKTTVRAVTAQGRVSLANGIRVSCSVGKNGPLVKAGDEYINKDGAWVPAK